MENNTHSLVNLCLAGITDVHKIISLQGVADHLRHRISANVKADMHFLELLTEDSPTDVRVFDCSKLSEEEVITVFSRSDLSRLNVLQLDRCENCMTNNLLASIGSLPALTRIALSYAPNLSDFSMSSLCVSAPELRSIDLNYCPSLTSQSVDIINSHLGPYLRELYLHSCPHIEAMEILQFIKGMKNLQVLSMTDMRTVTDEFVSDFLEARGRQLKELTFCCCEQLTDMAFKFVAERCHELYALEMSCLNVTDAALKFLANGCSSVRKLKLYGNDNFSDDGVSSFMETSGKFLIELDLSFIWRIDRKTAISLNGNLLDLDLSHCGNLTLESVVLILRRCLLLKRFDLRGHPEITREVLEGCTNSNVQIILDTTPQWEILAGMTIQPGPLRYSPPPVDADD